MAGLMCIRVVSFHIQVVFLWFSIAEYSACNSFVVVLSFFFFKCYKNGLIHYKQGFFLKKK